MYKAYLLVKLWALIILLLLVPVALGSIKPVVLATCIVFLQIGMVLLARNFKPLAIFLLFALPYIYITLPHFSNGSFPLTLGYSQFDNELYYVNVLIIHSLFLAVITLFIPYIKTPFVIKDHLPQKDNSIIFYGLIFLMLCIMVLGRSGTSIFESGGYGSADADIQMTGGLAIYEYFLILFPLAYVYSGKKKQNLIILLVLSCTFSIKGMLFGGRIEAIQAMLQIFILFIDNKKLRLRKLILFLIIPSFFLIIFGFIRSNPNMKFTEITNMIVENYDLASYSFLGNHIDVYYSSTRLYGLVQQNVLSLSDRLYSWGLNILAVVVPYSKLPDLANIAAFKQADYPAGGGGLISVCFYVFLSYPGVVLIGSIFGLVIRRIISNHQPIILLYGIMILSTYPRWFAYSPIVFFKMSFYIIPAYLFINFIFHKKQKNIL